MFQWQVRKGWPILIEAFARTFSRHDDVCLVIKTGRAGGSTDDFVPQNAGFFVATRRVALRLEEFNVDEWGLEPAVQSLVERLRLVFTNEAERQSKAERLSAHVRKNFCWGRAAEVAKMRLKCLSAT